MNITNGKILQAFFRISKFDTRLMMNAEPSNRSFFVYTTGSATLFTAPTIQLVLIKSQKLEGSSELMKTIWSKEFGLLNNCVLRCSYVYAGFFIQQGKCNIWFILISLSTWFSNVHKFYIIPTFLSCTASYKTRLPLSIYALLKMHFGSKVKTYVLGYCTVLFPKSKNFATIYLFRY